MDIDLYTAQLIADAIESLGRSMVKGMMGASLIIMLGLIGVGWLQMFRD